MVTAQPDSRGNPVDSHGDAPSQPDGPGLFAAAVPRVPLLAASAVDAAGIREAAALVAADRRQCTLLAAARKRPTQAGRHRAMVSFRGRSFSQWLQQLPLSNRNSLTPQS